MKQEPKTWILLQANQITAECTFCNIIVNILLRGVRQFWGYYCSWGCCNPSHFSLDLLCFSQRNVQTLKGWICFIRQCNTQDGLWNQNQKAELRKEWMWRYICDVHIFGTLSSSLRHFAQKNLVFICLKKFNVIWSTNSGIKVSDGYWCWPISVWYINYAEKWLKKEPQFISNSGNQNTCLQASAFYLVLFFTCVH